jgi:hypothetical protein
LNPANNTEKDQNMNRLLAMGLSLFFSMTAAQADQIITFNVDIKADKVQPGNQILPVCNLFDANGIALTGTNLPVSLIKTVAADGTFNGSYSARASVTTAQAAQAASWICVVQQGPVGGVKMQMMNGARPTISGKFH